MVPLWSKTAVYLRHLYSIQKRNLCFGCKIFLQIKSKVALAEKLTKTNEHADPQHIDAGFAAEACPCCGNEEFFEVVGFRNAPATGIFRSQIDGDMPSGDLRFDACLNCGLLRRRDFSCPPDYTDRPRSTEKQLPTYRDDLLAAIASVAKHGDLIADIGSNDGTFLRLLRETGYTNTYGVEPALALAELSRQTGLRVQSGYFGPDIVNTLVTAYGGVRLATCRHTLEHVPFPGSFVAAIRDLLVPERGVAMIEVPDSAVIADWFNFVELWDEHLHYFTASTLELLLKRNGLTAERTTKFRHLDTRNLLVQVSVADTPDAPVSAMYSTSDPQGVAKWRDFSRKFRQFADRFRNEAARFPRPIYLVGASHPQCNFVNYLGIGEFVDFMIDDDLGKSGKYPPISGPGARIMTTEQFFACPDGGTVILTGFGYPGWTNKVVERATVKAMTIVDPKSFVEL